MSIGLYDEIVNIFKGKILGVLPIITKKKLNLLL